MARRSKAGLTLRGALPVILVIFVAYVLSERAAVQAGVDSLTFIGRLRGGFLCIGTCADKPGIMVLSQRPRGEVDVRAATDSLLGRTTLTLDLGGRTEERQLDRPCIILLPRDGGRRIIPVDWDTAIFAGVLAKADCGGQHNSSDEHPNCGRPFLDLIEYLREHCPGQIPPELETFIANEPDRFAPVP